MALQKLPTPQLRASEMALFLRYVLRPKPSRARAPKCQRIPPPQRAHCTALTASLASCTHGPAAQRAREAPLPRARPDDLSDKEFDEEDVRAAQRAANQGRASSHT